jgi:hypothetical protein
VALDAGRHTLETFISLREEKEYPEPLPGKRLPLGGEKPLLNA